MSKTIVLLFFMFLGFDSVSNAKSDENISIQYLINQYAALNRANFILSPEVFGEVELSELKVEKIAKSDLKEIFSANGFIAVQKHDAIYVYTQYEVEHLGVGFGPQW
jgi:hypothetical protein